MAVPPNANIDASNPPSSNVASKTPSSSRMYILVFFHPSAPLRSPLVTVLVDRTAIVVGHQSIIDLLATDRLPTVSASDAFRNISDDHQSPSNAYTGISELDDALGGGFECGRVTELWGPPGAGKSAIAYVDVFQNQRVFTLTFSQLESRCLCSSNRCSCCLDR